MKRKLFVNLFVMLFVMLGLLTGCQQQSQEEETENGTFQPGVYIDDMGRQVTVDEFPERIVSFGPSITEILFALGLGEQVVGVSDFSDYPEEAHAIPKVGSAFSPSKEKVLELEPDLVITVEHEQFNSDLEALGINYIILDPDSFSDIIADIRLAGEVTGKKTEAEQLATDMEETIDEVVKTVEGAGRPGVFFIVDATEPNMPWTASTGSFIDDIINMAGGKNIAAGAMGDWVQLSIEEIVDAEPDIIVVQTMTGGIPTVSAEELEEHIIWQQLSAVQEGNIYFINGDLVSRPGPRIVQGLEEMAKIIHPELFE